MILQKDYKKLKWGQTPFDKLSKKELLYLVKKMYSALNSVKSVLNIIKGNQSDSLFWKEGSGYNVLEKVNLCIDPVIQEYNSEDIYHAYYRYANDLLFSRELGFNWVICSKCGSMIGNENTLERQKRIGQKCKDVLHHSCDGTFREITWEDLQPITNKVLKNNI